MLFKAKKRYQLSILSQCETLGGGEYVNSAILTTNLNGDIDLGDSEKAIAYYEQALSINMTVFGEQHPDVATSYNYACLASVDHREGRDLR